METPMISKLMSLAASALFAAGLATAPAAAATPAAPAGKLLQTLPNADKSNAIQVRHLRRNSPICRRWRIRGWRYGNRRARIAYARHCRGYRRGYRSRLMRQCRRWRHLGWRRGQVWARRAWLRSCRFR